MSVSFQPWVTDEAFTTAHVGWRGYCLLISFDHVSGWWAKTLTFIMCCVAVVAALIGLKLSSKQQDFSKGRHFPLQSSFSFYSHKITLTYTFHRITLIAENCHIWVPLAPAT